MTANQTSGMDCASAQAIVAAFDLKRPPQSFYDDPFPTYHAFRTVSPVHPMGPGSFLLTRYDDCIAVYKDPKLFSSDKRAEFKPKFGDGLLYQHHTTSLIFNDPPLHTRVRKIIAGALNPRAVADMEAPMTALVDQLLDQMAAKGEADLIADLAAAVPIEVIGNLLAIPHGERGPLRDWSLAILGALEPLPTPDMLARGETAVAEFLDYLRILVAGRRARPGNPGRDVLTRLIIGEKDGAKLTEIELLQNVIFILNAGHETTTNLIGNGLHGLLQWPEEKARLIANPALIATAVDEFLRFDSPVQLGNRMATADVTVGGVAMQAGTFITIAIGAANRDPSEFPDPDRLDLARSPNRHVAFASGPHFCVGLSIARMEGRVAIGRFLKRFPNYRLTGAATRGGRARFRGFLAIPVALS
jgi:cytochrome P450